MFTEAEQVLESELWPTRTVADIGTLEQLKRTHDLDLEVFTKVKEEEVEDVDMKDVSSASRPRARLKRQETLKTSEILKSMKSLNYDNADDATFDSITSDNYAFYARSLGVAGMLVVLLGYFCSQAFEVASKLWLAAWTRYENTSEGDMA